MKRTLQTFRDFINEAADPTYYQDTFYFTILISMDKNRGGSRDETKNDIRALPEVLTVTLIEKEKGGVQRDMGNTYLSTLKIHVRRPRDTSKELMMKRLVKQVARLKGVSVLRYKEQKPKQRKKAFRGVGSYTKRVQNVNESEYWQSEKHMQDVMDDAAELTKHGPQDTPGGPYDSKRTSRGPWKSAPPGAPGGLEETTLDEAMKTATDLPEDIVVVIHKDTNGSGFQVYYAHKDKPNVRLKAGDLNRMEAGIDIYGTLYVEKGQDDPYKGVYIVTSSKAKQGFGPLLYDVALELAGDSGLKPDPFDVSDDASGVWKHYDTQRDDVESNMLVDIEDFDKVMPPDKAENPKANQHLAKVYIKKDNSTQQDLESANKLVMLKPGTAGKPSPKEELTDLAAELDIPIVKNRDLSRFDRLYEDVIISIGQNDDDLMAFDVQPDLNQKIWDGDKMVRPGVKGALMDIVEEFMEGLDMDLDIKDIIVTGSIANYNWSKFSDIDLHILIDFAEVNDNEEMVKKFFDAVRSNWNKLHNILVKGHEVEIYVQDEQEPHVSTGVYSLMNDRWLVKPKKVRPAIDRHTATKKMKQIAREVDKLSNMYHNDMYQEAFEFAGYLKEKLKKMRRAGLERSGIYSPENLAFKMLRRSGDIETLFGVYTKSYDKLHSLDQ